MNPNRIHTLHTLLSLVFPIDLFLLQNYSRFAEDLELGRCRYQDVSLMRLAMALCAI